MNERGAWYAGGAFSIVSSVLAIVKYRSFHTGVDLGIFTQAIATGGPALRDAVEGGSHFAFHFSPVLYLCVPLLALVHSAVALQVVQACASGLTAPAVYRIARRSLPARTAFALTAAALLYPPLVAVTFVDFHENAFVAPVVLWLVWSVLERRYRLAAALAFAMLAIKEDEALALAFAAAVTGLAALRSGEGRLAIACASTFAVSVATCAAYFAWLQPLAADGRAWSPLHFYAAAGGGSVAVVPYASPARLGYVLEALYPVLFMPLASPRIVFVLPGMLEDVLSRSALPFSMDSHYPAVWIPWLLFAAIDGYSRAFAIAPLRMRFAAFAACVPAAVLVFASPTHWRKNLSWPSGHDALVQRRLDALPASAVIGTQDEIFSHLGFDAGAQVGALHPVARPALVLIDTTRAGDSYFEPLLQRTVAARDSGYEPAAGGEGVLLYRQSAGVAGVEQPPEWNRSSLRSRR